MRLRHPNGDLVHLAYCTNVHAAEDVSGFTEQLARYCEPIRERVGVDRLGLGLWLSADLLPGLDTTAVRSELDRRGLEVVTLNAFPYRAFQSDVVKHAVYHPDWTDPARLEYTLDCARVLAELLPDDVGDGSVSTLPLAWRTPWSSHRHDTALRALDRLTDGLRELADRTGRVIRVGFEPEPGCVIERTDQAAALLAHADPDWLGVCLDTCHLAVAFEEPGQALAGLAAAGVPLVKAQLSCALQADTGHQALSAYAEPRFLHQTRTPGAGVDDLPDALAGGLADTEPWRVHFHVPLHSDPPAPLRSTREHLRASMAHLFGGSAPLVRHAEVETYTWTVLGADVVDGVAAELDWARAELTELGLT